MTVNLDTQQDTQVPTNMAAGTKETATKKAIACAYIHLLTKHN